MRVFTIANAINFAIYDSLSPDTFSPKAVLYNSTASAGTVVQVAADQFRTLNTPSSNIWRSSTPNGAILLEPEWRCSASMNVFREDVRQFSSLLFSLHRTNLFNDTCNDTDNSVCMII